MPENIPLEHLIQELEESTILTDRQAISDIESFIEKYPFDEVLRNANWWFLLGFGVMGIETPIFGPFAAIVPLPNIMITYLYSKYDRKSRGVQKQNNNKTDTRFQLLNDMLIAHGIQRSLPPVELLSEYNNSLFDMYWNVDRNSIKKPMGWKTYLDYACCALWGSIGYYAENMLIFNHINRDKPLTKKFMRYASGVRNIELREMIAGYKSAIKENRLAEMPEIKEFLNSKKGKCITNIYNRWLSPVIEFLGIYELKYEYLLFKEFNKSEFGRENFPESRIGKMLLKAKKSIGSVYGNCIRPLMDFLNIPYEYHKLRYFLESRLTGTGLSKRKTPTAEFMSSFYKRHLKSLIDSSDFSGTYHLAKAYLKEAYYLSKPYLSEIRKKKGNGLDTILANALFGLGAETRYDNFERIEYAENIFHPKIHSI
ncbi:MAG: hypothetical protein KKF44_08210 [Nanoarchaeota archaeon]|nr:hypothetical protein [Nanoarchaeota archaeon]